MLWCFYSNLLTFCNKDLLRTNRFPLIQTNTNQSNPLLEDINSLNVQIFLTLLPIKPGHFPMTIPTPCLMPTGPPVGRPGCQFHAHLSQAVGELRSLQRQRWVGRGLDGAWRPHLDEAG